MDQRDQRGFDHKAAFINFNLLSIPRPGAVLGLVGTNGIGKSTALKILAGKVKPNLGMYNVSITFLQSSRSVCVEELDFCSYKYNST